MTISAKFPGTCPCCSRAIAVGDKIEWSKGTKARHVACPGSSASFTATATVRRSPGVGKRTGCSCGSREDSNGSLIHSARNCSNCEHDA